MIISVVTVLKAREGLCSSLKWWNSLQSIPGALSSIKKSEELLLPLPTNMADLDFAEGMRPKIEDLPRRVGLSVPHFQSAVEGLLIQHNLV